MKIFSLDTYKLYTIIDTNEGILLFIGGEKALLAFVQAMVIELGDGTEFPMTFEEAMSYVNEGVYCTTEVVNKEINMTPVIFMREFLSKKTQLYCIELTSQDRLFYDKLTDEELKRVCESQGGILYEWDINDLDTTKYYYREL